MPGVTAVGQELVKLRRGRALQSTRLRGRVGPRLRTAAGIRDGDTDTAIRQKVTALIRRLAGELPPDLRQAINVAIAIERDAQFPKLAERENWLAMRFNISDRAARRRVDDACRRLAELIHHHRDDGPADPEQGWYVSRLSALLCLDTPEPELYEDRTIVAERNQLAEIRTRFTLPRQQAGDNGPLDLTAKVLHGAQLRGTERLGGGIHFRHTLALPRPLQVGESMSYAMVYRLPPGQQMRPYYTMIPLARCEAFQVRIRFDRERPPEAIWRLERVAPRLLDDQWPGSTQLTLDPAGDLRQDFTDLLQGYGYGVGWRPAAAP